MVGEAVHVSEPGNPHFGSVRFIWFIIWAGLSTSCYFVKCLQHWFGMGPLILIRMELGKYHQPKSQRSQSRLGSPQLMELSVVKSPGYDLCEWHWSVSPQGPFPFTASLTPWTSCMPCRETWVSGSEGWVKISGGWWLHISNSDMDHPSEKTP